MSFLFLGKITNDTDEILEIAELFIAKGADVNHKDDYGLTPLISAAFTGNIKFVKFLVEKGANLDSKITCKYNWFYKCPIYLERD